MDKFESLDQEKQLQIINAGLKIFANYGYRKASASEIAKQANISKPMIFYYFGSKLNFYEYLVNYCYETIYNKLLNHNVKSDDFFEFLWQMAELKMSGLKKHPSIIKFLTCLYLDDDEAIAKQRENYLARASELQAIVNLDQLDYSKFKPTVDPDLLYKMLAIWSEGYINSIEKAHEQMDENEIILFFDQMMTEFKQTLDMFKLNFYKEQCL